MKKLKNVLGLAILTLGLMSMNTDANQIIKKHNYAKCIEQFDSIINQVQAAGEDEETIYDIAYAEFDNCVEDADIQATIYWSQN